VLLITGKALPNVLGAHVQLGSQDWSTFIDMEANHTIDAIGCRRPDHLVGEPPISDCPM
jgi:hypothetical protein